MSPTSSIVLATALVLLGAGVVALAVRRHRGGRHRAPEPMTTVLAARTGVGAMAVGSMASSALVLVGHGAGTGTTVQAADQVPGSTGGPLGAVARGGATSRALDVGGAPSPPPAITGPLFDRSPSVPAPRTAPDDDRVVVVPAPRSPLDEVARTTRASSPARHVSPGRHGGAPRRQVAQAPVRPTEHRPTEHRSTEHPPVDHRSARHRAVERDDPCPGDDHPARFDDEDDAQD